MPPQVADHVERLILTVCCSVASNGSKPELPLHTRMKPEHGYAFGRLFPSVFGPDAHVSDNRERSSKHGNYEVDGDDQTGDSDHSGSTVNSMAGLIA
jgi:hypothetical protein